MVRSGIDVRILLHLMCYGCLSKVMVWYLVKHWEALWICTIGLTNGPE